MRPFRTTAWLGGRAGERPGAHPGTTGPRRQPPGRVLAVKWGLNPNSSSLGVDVTFLLFGAAALSLATPVISALIRLRRPAADPYLAAPDVREAGAAQEPPEAGEDEPAQSD